MDVIVVLDGRNLCYECNGCDGLFGRDGFDGCTG